MSEKPMPIFASGGLPALVAAMILGFAVSAAEAIAPDATMALCRNAAVAAAGRHGVPREVMLAITQVETRTKRGGQSGPWPWTVNVAGKGAWFDSRAAALVHAQQALAAGQNSFDVGCFQLNYRWHGEHFASVDAMFEPGISGDYAARFLKELFAETGNWIVATGHYHSRTPVHATGYRNLVSRTIERMGGAAASVRVAAAAEALRAATPANPRRVTAEAEPVRVAEARAPLVVRADGPGVRPSGHGIQVHTPRGTSRINGAMLILRAPGSEVLALR